MKRPLNANEVLVRQGLANALCGAENVGGKLYLTNQRLIFESHGFNLQTGTFVVELASIAATGIGRTLVFATFRVTPNMFYVDTPAGRFEFTVYGRKAWQRAVDAQSARI